MGETKPPPAEPPRITSCDPIPGFSPGIGRYVAQLGETRREVLSQIGALTADQLSWHPNERTESIGTQILHIAAIEWSWVFEDIFHRPASDYDGWDEALPIRLGLPQVRDRPLAFYTSRLDRVRRDVLDALRGLTDDDLPRLIPEAAPPPLPEQASRLFSIDWILFHLVHHEAHHAGQIELLARRLPER